MKRVSEEKLDRGSPEKMIDAKHLDLRFLKANFRSRRTSYQMMSLAKSHKVVC